MDRDSVVFLVAVNSFVAGMLTFIFTRARQRLNVSLARVIAKSIHLVVAGWTVVTVVWLMAQDGGVEDTGGDSGIAFLLFWVFPVALGETIAWFCTRDARTRPPIGTTGRREWLIAFLLTLPFSMLFAFLYSFARIDW